jgi:alpha-tubulin suppressor-like RCC1 family protein
VLSLGAGRTARVVAGGHNHTCALLDDGAVKCWGHNAYGQLGLGDVDDRGDEPGEMGDALPAVDLGTGRTATAVACGGWHTCAVLDNGEVKCWGHNQRGLLGLGDAAQRGDNPGEMGEALPAVDLGAGQPAVAIGCGEYHTCVLRGDDSVKCWGGNEHGQLGLGDIEFRGDEPGEMGDALPAVQLR